jgi:hypothetical protein
MESIIGNGDMAKGKGAELDKRASIRVYSKRNRLTDPDGISAKAVIDGLVIAGVFPDDNSKFIKEVSYCQEISAIEETVIDITWL